MSSMVEPQYQPSVNRSWGERIINSASGLARDVFNGSGYGIDVPYGFAGKASSQALPMATTAAREVPRRRQGGGILACDFRRLREAEEEAQREIEFKRFAESGVGSWKESEGEGMCGGYAEMQARGEEYEREAASKEEQSEQPQGKPAWFEARLPSNVTLRPAVMGGWQSPASSSQTTLETGKTTDLWKNLDEVEDIWTRSQSAAVERLQQIQNHLSESTRRQPRKHILRPIQPLPEDFESFQSLLQTIRTSQFSPTTQDASNLEITYFHCPHMECHRRLEQLNSNLPVDFQTRACVHTGCGFVSRSVDEWVLHCSAAEHHVVEERGKQFCGRCMTVEDSHI
ncbi:hypothetical protein M409DRAFT_18582 [Zasmidium cellare ATCC 36951]|uniref:Uncharacterized protein n=1 Tax=Zasmidium cellare ATCC 36951 TaxID=1080233 RepID=A0A6A6CWR2_ZASCE|nr:uncharacterized protein M409DRAFT_18582 [Zasmidium cellare ATCC 36951]KAF2171465.1 hypothetical protein M409DRAFT_18582 [Zasmidium cellare ATCC 36951]